MALASFRLHTHTLIVGRASSDCSGMEQTCTTTLFPASMIFSAARTVARFATVTVPRASLVISVLVRALCQLSKVRMTRGLTPAGSMPSNHDCTRRSGRALGRGDRERSQRATTPLTTRRGDPPPEICRSAPPMRGRRLRKFHVERRAHSSDGRLYHVFNTDIRAPALPPLSSDAIADLPPQAHVRHVYRNPLEGRGARRGWPFPAKGRLIGQTGGIR